MISSIKLVSSSLSAIAGIRRSIPAKLQFSPFPIIENFQKLNHLPQKPLLSSQNLSNFTFAAAATQMSDFLELELMSLIGLVRLKSVSTFLTNNRDRRLSLGSIAQLAAIMSMSKVVVSITHIIKSSDPAFRVLVSSFFLGESFHVLVYLSLLPITRGCALATVMALNFNMIGFMGVMISNLAFVLRNIFSKKRMKGKSMSGMNYYACLYMMSLLIVTPFAIAVEGPQMWAGLLVGKTLSPKSNQTFSVAQSVFYHLNNQVSYMSLDQISPLTFSVGNTMKRISVIVSSMPSVLPLQFLGLSSILR
ncbi:unnamed protein product [Arabidopsis thaliana]|uniref:(thale cress) hypothetical protein n=1 Tax=Arabidopsis thaliana TaxID=3702 RepID=A0A7G2FBW0_ARATH|nr:unnamed protein product [Arabidopsis thaliana]